MRSVQIASERQLYGGDKEGNLLAFSEHHDPVILDTRFNVLYTVGGYHVGSPITCLVPGLLRKPEADSVLSNPVIYCCESGEVGIVGQLTDDVYQDLLKVQQSMQSEADAAYRNKLVNAATSTGLYIPPFGRPDVETFIDGNILFKLLNMSEEDRIDTLMSSGVSVERAMQLIEALYDLV
jgi:hypothetical protein